MIVQISKFQKYRLNSVPVFTGKGAGKTTYIVSARFRFLLPTYPDLT